MQGLADGYFVVPYTVQNYLADQINVPFFKTDTPEFEKAEKEVRDRLEKLLGNNGTKTVDSYHKKLGLLMWDHVGMARNKEGLEKTISEIRALRADFWKNVKVPGTMNGVNVELEKATRVADFLELGELMAVDALTREESCGGHFREEYQTEEGEAVRNDKDYMFVSAWEFKGVDQEPVLHKEALNYEYIEVKTRNYKEAKS
jgi:succinate dehydrogenase / fumarate reductase flavoprotein subunit